MKYRYFIFDVFSSTAFGGNQLAVLPDAAGLTSEGMQAIAREFNLSETTFVLAPSSPEFFRHVRIFTPRAELPFAGHPTVGTACALVHDGQLGKKESYDLILEEKVGPVKVHVDRHGTDLSGALTLDRPIEQPAERLRRNHIAAVLSLDEADVTETFFASAGLPFCFVRLADAAAVDRAAVNSDAWNAHLAKAWSPHIFFFSGELKNGGALYARMSAPALGMAEDPATGSACAALVGAAANMARGFDGQQFRLSVLQGVSMGRRSTLEAAAEKRNGAAVSVSVGGPSAFVSAGEIEVPDRFIAPSGNG